VITDRRNKILEALKKSEDLGKIFHEIYRRQFISPEWEKCSLDFRVTVCAGVNAVADEIRRRLDEAEKTVSG